MSYTLEEAIDFINSELEDAYTESSDEYKIDKKLIKTDALQRKVDLAGFEGKLDKARKLNEKRNKTIDKMIDKYGDNASYGFQTGFLPIEDQKEQDKLNKLYDKQVKKADKKYHDGVKKYYDKKAKKSRDYFDEDINHQPKTKKKSLKEIKKEYNNQMRQAEEDYNKRAEAITKKAREDAIKEKEFQDATRKLEEEFYKNYKKESVSNIYEAYCDDVIDAETAMGLLLTIEASEY